MSFILTSTAFALGAAIPTRYTCDGEDRSPELSWHDAPQGAVSFALIMDDPDAPRGVFTHWVLFNLPAGMPGLAEGVTKTERLAGGGMQGRNDFGKIGYGGPCPPPGNPHHYRFTLYALDTTVQLKPGATKQQAVDALRNHVLAQAQLVGTYQRGRR